MPPKRKAAVEKSVARPSHIQKATASNHRHNGNSSGGNHTPQNCGDAPAIAARLASTEVDSRVHNMRTFYETGRFVSPPHTYTELLRAYVEFVVCSVPGAAPSTAPSTAPTSSPLHNGAATTTRTAGHHPAPPPAVDRETQVRALLFVAVPHRVAAYFEEIQLLPLEEEEEDAPERAAGRKRDRGPSSPSSTHDRQKHPRPLEKEGEGVGEAANGSGAPADTVADSLSPQIMQQRLAAYGAEHLPGFDSDSAYLAAKDVLIYMEHYAYLLAGMMLGASLLRSIEVANLDFRRQCVPCVEATVQLVRRCTEAQLRKMSLEPRVVRLSTRLHLSAKAARTLEYMLVCQCGRYTPGAIAEPLRPVNIAYHNDLTPQELLSILSDSGVLWKQGLAFSDIKMRSSFTECRYGLPLETIAALSGDQLSEEQLIKLERTALSEVLNEERQMKPTRSVSPGRGAIQTSGEKSGRPPLATSFKNCSGRNNSGSGGARGFATRRRSRSPLPRRRGEAAEERAEQDDDDVDYDETASTADSTLTTAEDALEDVLDHIDPKILAAGDPKQIQEAVAQHLHSSAAAAAESKKKTTAVAVATSMTAKTAEVAEETQDGEQGSVGAAPTATAGAPLTPAASTLDTARKPRLALADINPLAQRCRHGTADPNSPPSSSPLTAQTDPSLRGKPYDSDIEYMDAAFRILANIIRIRYAEGDMKDEDDSFSPKNKVEASLRELKGKVRVAAAVHESRLQATLAANTFTPRIEQLAGRLKLTEMEKQIMLFMVGNVVSHDMLVAVNGRYVMQDGQRPITVGYTLFVLCETLEERVVARRAFYQSAPLVANGVLSLSFETTSRSRFNTDLMEYLVDIDRKIVDDVMGITAETAEMVPGSQLYLPSVQLANVVLPTSTMDRVLSTIEHYSLFEQCKKQSGFGDGLGMSKGGLVMLFFGPSGTGKTMLANAVAHHLQKKILLVSISQFRSSTKAEGEALKFLFREAKLSEAIIFFDECESLFEDRQNNTTVTALLSEFENYDGLIILATNKAQNFDEAMNRRISLMMEFRPPDHQLRLRIWKSHLPPQLPLADDVSVEKLALNYELSGGLIRNAVLAALSQAVAREKSASPTLTMADLDEGARLQLRGFFLAAERPEGVSESYVTPKNTLAALVLEAPLAKKLETIASVAKIRSTLYTQWGFSEDANDNCGALYLFHGVSGTGKSLAAEGIAYECGATIRLCNVAELLLREEMHVHAVFEEGRRLGAIIVFDEAQVLFNESPKSLQLSQLIQYHARRYPRPVIVIATTTSRDGGGGRQLFSTHSVNSRSSCMLFQAEIAFVLPSRPLREKLWRRAFPERAPIAVDVDYAKLSASGISPKLIRTVAFNVCCEAALLPVAERTVTMAMIEQEIEKALVRERSSASTSAMFA
ncbi:putative AAA family ATPase [Leptomonas pyrrhocoris]|uniref:Putative AAA family ATPase n=1 Tax=Leptomonas pyrrhocoris TaxID=157538 RepID=A0A0N0VED7_LEPPY|nr:putative AAA family ATPase [Leptomonas pyrrhocoris]XP_015656113.1 putative AAA family ATPase [Leptomonas pyrrhocoris]KPA77673.1 putative AAA family ATPase [Leptomonas pyrrhocoris]KPA77674.1 putative AAA family ATPase [Leptomonas pyrrhocoris]|eukprot:XP_015656112.1 putative AAA family ATPase [Leptomonas pyrrhocoris]